MNYKFSSMFLLILLFFSFCEKDTKFKEEANIPEFPSDNWIKVTDPEIYHWSNEMLESTEEFAKASGSECAMVIENGRLIYSWGRCDKKFYVASIRKSFLSMIFGYFIGNQIILDATLADYNIDDKNPPLNDQEKRASVNNLLSSTSGVYHEAAASDGNDLPERNSALPGEKFYYNNWDFNALGTIFENQTQSKIFKVFSDSISQRIGMQDFNWEVDGRYDFSDVSIHPAYHFDMTARDLARVGLMVLNSGKWNGTQILPPNWIREITSKKISVSNDYGGGSYGYMWWVNDGGYMVDFSGVSPDAFSAQGHWSQIILVIPSKQLVIVHRATKNLDSSRMLMIIRMILNSKNSTK